MRGVIIENEYNYTYKNKVDKKINDFLSFFVIDETSNPSEVKDSTTLSLILRLGINSFNHCKLKSILFNPRKLFKKHQIIFIK